MKNNWIFAVSMTVLWCIVFVSAMHDWVTGICLGLCMGIAFGLFGTGNGNGESGKREGE